MMRSLFAGVSGLKNHQTRMDVIGNNIANVNTIGYKGSRVNFQDVLSQTLQGASSGQGNMGGTNPMQVGLGVGLASIDTIFNDGSFQPTGKQTDLSIQGQGFFVLSADGGLSKTYTRAGNFDFDRQGNFIVPGTGYKVMGWQANSAGVIDTTQPVQPIKIPVGATMPAQVTTKISFDKNLSSDVLAANSAVQGSINVYDAQGNAYKVSGTFQKTATLNQWSFTPSGNALNPTTGATNGAVTMLPAGQTSFTINFNTNGAFLNATGTAPGNATGIHIAPTTGTAFDITTVDFSALTQYGGDSTVEAADQDGYAAGTLDTQTIDTSGTIVGRFTNGKTQNLGQVCLATFNNPGGLTRSGDSLFTESTNSGLAQIGTSGVGGRGTFNPGTLEMSNVDLAQEFSNMIITERGFQANSKIISVADEMLQDLANLKR